jgi:hypothetical protein
MIIPMSKFAAIPILVTLLTVAAVAQSGQKSATQKPATAPSSHKAQSAAQWLDSVGYSVTPSEQAELSEAFMEPTGKYEPLTAFKTWALGASYVVSPSTTNGLRVVYAYDGSSFSSAESQKRIAELIKDGAVKVGTRPAESDGGAKSVLGFNVVVPTGNDKAVAKIVDGLTGSKNTVVLSADEDLLGATSQGIYYTKP